MTRAERPEIVAFSFLKPGLAEGWGRGDAGKAAAGVVDAVLREPRNEA